MRTACPSCPDGNEWGSNGPTGRACPTCKGNAFVGEDEPEDLEEEEDTGPFCACGAVHTISESDANKCAGCGKPIEPEGDGSRRVALRAAWGFRGFSR